MAGIVKPAGGLGGTLPATAAPAGALVHKCYTPSPRRSFPVVRATDSDGASSSIPDAVPTVPADADWRAFRAKLVASSAGPSTADAPGPLSDDDPWAHFIPSPEQGCLLVASPLFFTQSQTYFNQAVILLHEHGPNGSAGLIINKPTQYRIGELADCTLSQEFGPCTLYLGGDVDVPAVNCLHGTPGLPHSVQVVPGVYLGGFEGVRAALAAGEARPEEVKVLTRMAGWAPGQLEDEVARGVWIPAAASRHFMLQPLAVGAGEELWHGVLQVMGGDFAHLSAAMKEEFRADIMGLGGRMGEEGGPPAPRPEDHDHGSGI